MGESRPPPFVICHLCGRKYGTKSIEIHVPQCQKKWHEENQKLPKHLRRRLPKKPDYGLLQSGTYNADTIDQINDMSFKASQAQLIPCENCGRTFYPEKLPVHQRSCTVEKPAKSAAKVPKHCKISTSQRNTNTHSDESDIIKRNVEIISESKNASNVNIASTILCSICLQHIPAKKIQTHLVRCNEEKIKSIQQTEKTKNIGFPEESKRPRTRTIRRSSTPKIPNNGTFDIVEPNKNRSYNVDVPAIIDSELNHYVTCELCNRKFTDNRIDQHKVICSKIKKKQRKTFDSSKQRMQGIEIVNRNKSKYKEQPSVPKCNWKQKHEEFIQSIRAAKTVTAHMAKGGKASDIPPPPPSLNPDYVYCQYCDRRFNPVVAERHIPKCATIMNRPAPPKKKALDNYQNPSNKRDSKSEKIREKKTSSTTGYRSPRLESRYESFERCSTGKYKGSSHDKSFESHNSSKSLPKKNSKNYNNAYSYNSVKEGSSRKSSGGFIF